MKIILSILITALVAWGLYHYFSGRQLDNITIKNNIVTLSEGHFDLDFSPSGEFKQAYMIFGGAYQPSKIQPVTLFGLGITDAKSIYASYRDFYRCASPGASLAEAKIQPLNLIPATSKVRDELKESIKEHDNNVANNGDRVCVSLIGKTLNLKGFRPPPSNEDMKNLISQSKYYLINSSQRVNCKSLLDQPY